ncbi:MAG: hypothetical protein HPY83_04040 [Anaerolineae bacterium]|nr:hypothetical protein [Anaerolineae bacterium]
MSSSSLRGSVRGCWARISLALVVLAALVAAAPLLLGPLPATDDGLHHLFRLFELDRALRAGHLYPRLFAGMGFGYGYPVLNFYSPLGYYVAWIGTALGTGYIGGIRLAHVLGLLTAAAATYAWVALLLPRPAAVVAAVAYTAFPYHLADIYVRGALAESLAFAFPPLLLWVGTLMRGDEQRAARPWLTPFFALGTAAFILTHNLTALMFALPLALYFVLLYGSPRSAAARWPYARLIGAGTLGIGLAAFFWVPAILEVRYVLAGQVTGLDELLLQLQPLREWFSPFLIHRYRPHQLVAAQHPLGLAQTVLAPIGAAALALQWRQLPPPARRAGAFAATVSLGTVALLLPASAPLWEKLPLLHYLQFPWRLQAVLTLCSALLAAGVVAWVRPGPFAALAAGALGAALMIAGMGGLRLESAHLPGYDRPLAEADIGPQGLVEYDYQTALWLREHGGEWLLEYMPVWALPRRADFFLPEDGVEATLPPVEVTAAQLRSADPLSLDLAISLASPGTISFHRFFFPGWRITADGRPLEPRPYGPLGLLAADLPAGEHLVQLRPGATPPRTLGAALSALALLAIVIWSWRSRTRLPLALLAGAALFAALVAFRSHRYPTAHVPVPIQAQVGEAALLLGFHADRQGDWLEVTLYWLALDAHQDDYRVFVHAVDPEGSLAAQHDGRPGQEFSPTRRWVPGEVLADQHLLPVPSGPVTLYAGMYTWPEVSNLPVLQDGAEVPDRRVLLGEWGPR